MALIDKDTIRKEIVRRARIAEVYHYTEICEVLHGILAFLDTIPEQPASEEKFRNLLDAMGDCGFSQDNILLLKSIWEDAYGTDKKGILEQPEDDLEKEIARFALNGGTGDNTPTIGETARHFYELGLNSKK